MGVRERKEWGDTDEAGPATMTSRALKVGMTQSWGGAHQFRVSNACDHVGYTVPVARVTCRLYACQQLVRRVFCARAD